MIDWMYYPKSSKATDLALAVVEAFESAGESINSATNNLGSNGVLAQVAQSLRAAGFVVESGKAKADKISVPVLFGPNAKAEKSFEADAYHPCQKQPCTKTTHLLEGRTISGRPGRCATCKRNRNPAACKNERTHNSGCVAAVDSRHQVATT